MARGSLAPPRPRAAAPPWMACLSDASLVAGRASPVAAVCYDSRRVVPGALFVAVPGYETDGHRYLRDALDRGATALLVQADRRPLWEPLLGEHDITVVSVPDTRSALAQAAASFYGGPGRGGG